ncbi:MAG: transporter substrate-binding domain-containing protein [Burkholderiaceae bacterium]|nr:transporter substrate-binding domain-containing protein [Burkholderiaceae bacterium]
MEIKNTIRLAAGLSGLQIGIASFAFPAITLQFDDRLPYAMQQQDGAVVGVLVSQAERIFHDADVPFVWARSSARRQWYTLQKAEEMNCVIGWFKTREREKLLKFTKAIYRDKPQVLIARNDFHALDGDSIEKILETRNVRVLLKSNYSYGPVIDELLMNLGSTKVVTDVEVVKMVAMLKANRADIMFASGEEAHFLLDEIGSNLAGLHLLLPSGMPPGERRYIACNKAVPDEIIERLNRAIGFE